MKILITGANGMLAKAVREKFKNEELICTDVNCSNFENLDITNLKDVLDFVEAVKPQYIINCAAYTAVDKAEEQKELALRINAVGPKNLAIAAEKNDCILVHISTDYVFPGNLPVCEAYNEYDEKGPVTIYGITKLQGEINIQNSCKKYYIFRTAWLYGEGKNFVRTMLKLGKEKECISVVNDQNGSPTYTEDLADIIAQALEKNIPFGVYNSTNLGFTTWYDFTKLIFKEANIKCEVKPVTSAEYKRPAERPLNSKLSKDKLLKNGIEIPTYQDALKRYLKKEEEGFKVSKFKKIETGIEGLYVIEPTVFKDDRGFFMETYSKKEFAEIGITYDFVQDNQSKSVKGVLRGLHFQKKYMQAKLVRVIKGAVYDVAVDLRKGSSTYGKYYGVLLTDENKRQFMIPRGFAHGFLVVSDEAEFVYKCDDFYHPNDEGGLIWNDPKVGIEWPLEEAGGEENLIFSEKDKKWPTIDQL